MGSPFLFSADPIETIARLRSLADDLEQLLLFRPSKQLRDAPILSDWAHSSRYATCLTGDVAGHPLLGNCKAMTSEIYAIDFDGGWVRTFNRYYKLGAPLKSEGGR